MDDVQLEKAHKNEEHKTSYLQIWNKFVIDKPRQWKSNLHKSHIQNKKLILNDCKTNFTKEHMPYVVYLAYQVK